MPSHYGGRKTTRPVMMIKMENMKEPMKIKMIKKAPMKKKKMMKKPVMKTAVIKPKKK
jgi:hypothetical protein